MIMGDLNIRLKDVIQWGITVTAAIVFFTTMNNKVDTLTATVNDLKTSREKSDDKSSIFYQSLQNQVTSQGSQIELIKQEIQYMKAGYLTKSK